MVDEALEPNFALYPTQFSRDLSALHIRRRWSSLPVAHLTNPRLVHTFPQSESCFSHKVGQTRTDFALLFAVDSSPPSTTSLISPHHGCRNQAQRHLDSTRL